MQKSREEINRNPYTSRKIVAEYMFSNICHFIPVSTHIRPKQLPLLVAQVGLEVHRLLVFSLGASWQSFWWFRSFHITGAGRWLRAALAGRVLQVFHETGEWSWGAVSDPWSFQAPQLRNSGAQILTYESQAQLCFAVQ